MTKFKKALNTLTSKIADIQDTKNEVTIGAIRSVVKVIAFIIYIEKEETGTSKTLLLLNRYAGLMAKTKSPLTAEIDVEDSADVEIKGLDKRYENITSQIHLDKDNEKA